MDRMTQDLTVSQLLAARQELSPIYEQARSLVVAQLGGFTLDSLDAVRDDKRACTALVGRALAELPGPYEAPLAPIHAGSVAELAALRSTVVLNHKWESGYIIGQAPGPRKRRKDTVDVLYTTQFYFRADSTQMYRAYASDYEHFCKESDKALLSVDPQLMRDTYVSEGGKFELNKICNGRGLLLQLDKTSKRSDKVGLGVYGQHPAVRDGILSSEIMARFNVIHHLTQLALRLNRLDEVSKAIVGSDVFDRTVAADQDAI